MAISIKFQKESKEDYIYSDLSLDLEPSSRPFGESNLTRKSGNSDIKTDFDEHAIANSLRNLFSTRPKQRILNPDYGLNIHQFLFEPANEYTARLIGRKITQGIQRYEPRVTLELVDIKVDAENNRYDISLHIFIPSLNKNVIYDSILENTQF